jgi:hypothetical protein
VGPDAQADLLRACFPMHRIGPEER